MTYADIITFAIAGGIAAFLVFLLVDLWLTHRFYVKERKAQEAHRRAYDQIIADTFRSKQ